MSVGSGRRWSHVLLVVLVVVPLGCGQGGQGAREGPADREASVGPVAQAPLDLSAGAVTLRVPLSGRRWAGLVVADRRVLVLGGQRPVGGGGDFQGLADGVFYDLDRQGWWALPDLPVPLFGMAGLWSGSQVVVVGTACASSVWVEEDDTSRCRPGGVRLFTWTPGADRWEEGRLEGLPVELERYEGVPWEFNPVGRAGRWLVFANASATTPAISSVGEGVVLWLYDPERGESGWVALPPGWGSCLVRGDLVAYPGGFKGGPVPANVLAEPVRLLRLDPDRLRWEPVPGSETRRPLPPPVAMELVNCSDDGRIVYEAVTGLGGQHALLHWQAAEARWVRLPDLVATSPPPAGTTAADDGTLAVYDSDRKVWLVLTPGASGWVERPGPEPPGGRFRSHRVSGLARAGGLRFVLGSADRGEHGRPEPGPPELLVEDRRTLIALVLTGRSPNG